MQVFRVLLLGIICAALLGATPVNAEESALSIATLDRDAIDIFTSSTRPENTSGFSCGGKTKCAQMDSCAEAQYYLKVCGLTRLDRDKDGIPCESICD